MNFNTFVENYFNGDFDKAMECLAREDCTKNYSLTGSRINHKAILDTMDSYTADKYVSEYLIKEMKKNPKIAQDIMSNALESSMINMTYDEIAKAEVNPYKLNLSKGFLKLLIGSGGLIALSSLLQGQPDLITRVSGGLITLFTSYCAMDVGINLINYFKFKKLKNIIDEKEQAYDNNSFGGKKL